MKAYFQARGLNVWRVVSEGMMHDNHQESQYDVITKNIMLSSLCGISDHRRVESHYRMHPLRTGGRSCSCVHPRWSGQPRLSSLEWREEL
jgi:hypothetical protein